MDRPQPRPSRPGKEVTPQPPSCQRTPVRVNGDATRHCRRTMDLTSRLGNPPTMGQRAHRSPPPTGGGLRAVPGVVARSGGTGAAEVASQLVHLAAKACLGAVWGVRDGGVPVACPASSPRSRGSCRNTFVRRACCPSPTPVALCSATCSAFVADDGWVFGALPQYEFGHQSGGDHAAAVRVCPALFDRAGRLGAVV